jgi:hypothetical protein
MRLDRILVFLMSNLFLHLSYFKGFHSVTSRWCQGSISTIPFTFLLIVLHMRMMGARGTFTRNELPNRVSCDLRLGD